jgi:hypothetical protein
MTKADSKESVTPSQQIMHYIAALPDWRGKLLARIRQLILQVDPDMVEAWKWHTPVWSHSGDVVAAGAFRDHVKLNFFKGAALKDSYGLFNAGLEAKTSRAIDLHEGDKINEPALKDLIRAAVAHNATKQKSSTR